MVLMTWSFFMAATFKVTPLVKPVAPFAQQHFAETEGIWGKRCFRHFVQERPQADIQELLLVKIDMFCIARPIFL